MMSKAVTTQDFKLGSTFWYINLSFNPRGSARVCMGPVEVTVTDIEIDPVYKQKTVKLSDGKGKLLTEYISIVSDEYIQSHYFLTKEEAVDTWNSIVINELDSALHDFEKRKKRINKKLI